MNLDRLTFGISLLLAALLTYASTLKLWSYFHSSIGFDFFPFVKDYHIELFWGLMVLQLLISGVLMFRRTRLLGLYIAFFLLASLSTYLHVMLTYATMVPCACIGIIPKISWQGHLWFTIGFAIVTMVNIALLPKDIHARG